MWTTGVAVRWAANVYPWEWRLLLPLSGLLELAAFLIFFRAVSQHRPEDSGKDRLDPWIWVVISASSGFCSRLLRIWRGASILRCAAQLRRCHMSRPTLSRIADLGIPGAVCLGIQYEVDDGVPWSKAGSTQPALERALC